MLSEKPTLLLREFQELFHNVKAADNFTGEVIMRRQDPQLGLPRKPENNSLSPLGSLVNTWALKVIHCSRSCCSSVICNTDVSNFSLPLMPGKSNTVMSVKSKRAGLINGLLGYVLLNRDTAARTESASTARCSSSICVLKSINTILRDDKHTKVRTSSLRLFWDYSGFLEVKGCVSPFSHQRRYSNAKQIGHCASFTMPINSSAVNYPKGKCCCHFSIWTTRTPSPKCQLTTPFFCPAGCKKNLCSQCSTRMLNFFFFWFKSWSSQNLFKPCHLIPSLSSA